MHCLASVSYKPRPLNASITTTLSVGIVFVESTLVDVDVVLRTLVRRQYESRSR